MESILSMIVLMSLFLAYFTKLTKILIQLLMYRGLVVPTICLNSSVPNWVVKCKPAYLGKISSKSIRDTFVRGISRRWYVCSGTQ